MADDVPTYCADGTVVKHAADEWENEDESDEEEEEQNSFFLSMSDTGGFLVQIKDGHIIINSAVHFRGMCPGPMPSVDLAPDCGFLDEVMTKFVEGFMKTSLELVK